MQLRIKQGGLLLLLLTLLLAMAGCGLFQEKASDKIDPPVKDESYVDNGESLDENATGENTSDDAQKTDATQETNKRVVYLLDKNGYVVPQTFNLPATKATAKQSLEYMVMDGPITPMLPDGFQAVLPAGTVINGINVQEGTAVVDFSKEFGEYKAENEQKILEAITYTLTQFDSIKNVKLRIEGKDLNAMPVNGTPIGDGVSRADGINLEGNTVVDIQNSDTVTLYFLANRGDNSYYYVPVTRRVKATDNLTVATINELLKGPSHASNLLSDFANDVELIGKPSIKEGIATLNFNKNLLDGGETISDQVLNSIVLSITENEGIKQVAIQVEGKTNLVNAKGDEITKPVSRPDSVNTVGF